MSKTTLKSHGLLYFLRLAIDYVIHFAGASKHQPIDKYPSILANSQGLTGIVNLVIHFYSHKGSCQEQLKDHSKRQRSSFYSVHTTLVIAIASSSSFPYFLSSITVIASVEFAHIIVFAKVAIIALLSPSSLSSSFWLPFTFGRGERFLTDCKTGNRRR